MAAFANIKATKFINDTQFVISYFYLKLLGINPFFFQLFYFLFLSTLGFGVLKTLKPKTSFRPRDIDLFFTSVSTSTVSSMSTVEMEVFSNEQLVAMTVLMFVGGEVFTSMVGLHFRASKLIRKLTFSERKVDSEAGPAHWSDSPHSVHAPNHKSFIKYESIKFLGLLVLGYLLIVQFLGIASVLIYISTISSAQNVLKSKGIQTFTFAVFTIVSTFGSCGYVPTNENMIAFKKNSGLLLILIPQVLLGNTLFPSCLRLLICLFGKKFKKNEAQYILQKTESIRYSHLLPSVHALLLVPTVVGFIAIGFVLFCSMEWNSEGLTGLGFCERFVSILFQCVNARHAGENTFDLSMISPAILVFFIIMMYLPPYTTFMPIDVEEQSPLECEGRKKNKRSCSRVMILFENMIFSQLSYLSIFIILICITERRGLKEDPLNFNVLSITLEVISAYGNVGFSTGYSCERQIRPDPNCVNKTYGFTGRWSDEGKVVLILVMLFGRLKNFSTKGGRAWILS